MGSSKQPQEEEYFKKIQAEKLEAIKARQESAAAAEAYEARKALHYNKCGRCGADMKARMFQGVEIDVCPECGTVLLDPGELETLAGEDHTGVINSVAEFFRFSSAKK